MLLLPSKRARCQIRQLCCGLPHVNLWLLRHLSNRIASLVGTGSTVTQHSRFPYILVPPDWLQWQSSRSYVYHRYKLSWLQCGAKYFWQPVAPFSVALRRTLLTHAE